MMLRPLARVRTRATDIALLTLLSITAGACSINPVSKMPEVTLLTVEQEKKIGEEEAKKVEQQMGLLDNEALTGYVNGVGQRLAKESPRQDVPYQFHVVDMTEPNAFALPGGYVYVTRGLLALVNTEDELAGSWAMRSDTSLHGIPCNVCPARGRSRSLPIWCPV